MSNELLEEVKTCVIPRGSLRFWWLGQQSWIVKTATLTLYIDPYLTPREKRNTPPLFTPEDMDNADFIFGSHDHSDHIDHPSIAAMMAASPDAFMVVPEAARHKLIDDGIASVRIISLGKTMEFFDHRIKITAIKAKHEFFNYSRIVGFPFLQYIIEVDDVVIYTAGDTLCYDGMLSTLNEWRVTVAFIPINGRDSVRYKRGCMGNMTWQEAADLAGELHPRLVCPAHYDMFSDNSEDPQKFIDYLDVKYPHQAYWVGLPGNGMLVKNM